MPIEGKEQLNGLEDRLLQAIINGAYNAMKTTTEKAVQTVKAIAPVDTGELRDSIRGDTEKDKEEVQSNVEAPVKHAKYTEFGTGIRGANSPSPPKYNLGNDAYNPNWKGQRAQPYLMPTYEEYKNVYINGVSKDIVTELNKLKR